MLKKELLLSTKRSEATGEGTTFIVDVGEWQGIDGQIHRGYDRDEGAGSINPNTFEGRVINQVIFMGYDPGETDNFPDFAFLNAKIRFDDTNFDEGILFIKMVVTGGPNGEQKTTLYEASGDERIYIGNPVSVSPEGVHYMELTPSYDYDSPDISSISVSVRNMVSGATFDVPVTFTSNTGEAIVLMPGEYGVVETDTLVGNYIERISSSVPFASGATVNVYLDREEHFDFTSVTSVSDVDTFRTEEISAGVPWSLEFGSAFAQYRSICFNVMMSMPPLPI